MANLLKLFSTGKQNDNTYLELLLGEKAARLHIAEMAIEKAVALIADVVSKSDFTVYRWNPKTKTIEQKVDKLDYTLNIKPNQNQTGSEFWREVIRVLLKEQQALIVQINYKWYLADSYIAANNVLSPRTFSGVTIGDMKLNKVFVSDMDAIELKYDNKDARDLIDSFNKEFGELLAVSTKAYKRNNRLKMKMTMPHGVQMKQPDGSMITANEYSKTIEQKLQSNNDEVMSIGNAIEFSSIINDKGGPSVKDSLEVAKYIYEHVAIAFHIPVPVLYGTTTEKSDAVNDLITFAVSPVFETLKDALTSGLLGEESYILGERIGIDTSRIKHVDIFEIAQSLDKLFSIGFTHNELRKITGWEQINSEWANTRHVTKNYVSEIELKEQSAMAKGGK